MPDSTFAYGSNFPISLARCVGTFSYHDDNYLLKQDAYKVNEWKNGNGGPKTANCEGETRTQELYLQGIWRLALPRTQILGGRAEYWQTFGG